MQAHFPRAYIDINREPYELDPVLFNGRLPDFVNSQSLRAIGGLGTIARIVNEKEEIYHGPLTLETAFIRIESSISPITRRLKTLMQATRAQFGDRFPARLSFDAITAAGSGRLARFCARGSLRRFLRS